MRNNATSNKRQHYRRSDSRVETVRLFHRLADEESEDEDAEGALPGLTNSGLAITDIIPFSNNAEDRIGHVPGTGRTIWDVLVRMRQGESVMESENKMVHGNAVSSHTPVYLKRNISKVHTKNLSRKIPKTMGKTVKLAVPVTTIPGGGKGIEVIDLTCVAGSEQSVERNESRISSVNLPSRETETYLDCLTVEEESILREKFELSPCTVVTYIFEQRVPLLASSFRRLRGDQWLDDEVINGFGAMLNGRNGCVFQERQREKRYCIPRTYMFSTFFYSKVSSGIGGMNYEGVRRWTRRLSVSVRNYDLLLFPINVGKTHWALGMIDMEFKEMAYLDPLYTSGSSPVLSTLKYWLEAELLDKKGKTNAEKFDVSHWACLINQYRVRRSGILPCGLQHALSKRPDLLRIPSQEDASSCGVFLIKIADCLSMGIPVYFDQSHVQLLRKKIALDLLRSRLLVV